MDLGDIGIFFLILILLLIIGGLVCYSCQDYEQENEQRIDEAQEEEAAATVFTERSAPIEAPVDQGVQILTKSRRIIAILERAGSSLRGSCSLR